MPTRSNRYYSLIAVCITIILTILVPASLRAAAPDIDFGLPVFGNEEIRLEREKPPSFNIQLIKKFLGESQGKPLVQLHAISHLINLLRLSDDQRAKELTSLGHALFRPASLETASKQELLNHLFLEGMLLVRESEVKTESSTAGNAPDIAFEKILLVAEDRLNDLPEYHLVKGILFQLLKNRPKDYFDQMKPVEDLKQAASMATNDAFFHYALGQAFRLLGTDENTLFFAIMEYEKAGALAPANGKLHHTLLGIYMGLHEGYENQKKHEPFWLEEAVYKKILTLAPNNPHAMNNLGFLYAEYGIHRQLARQLCQKAVDMIPDNPGFRDSLGWAAFKCGQFEKAEQELTQALQKNPDGYEPHYHLGTLYYVTKRPDKAIAMYDRAVAANPGAAEALNNYAFLLAENNRELDKAYDLAVRATRLEPDNPSYVDSLGWIEFKRGNTREALHHLKKAVNMSPDVGEILAHLGRVYLELRDFDSALSYITQAIKADPNLENLQHDVYMAVSLKAIHRAIADYHKLFGAKAQPAHLKGFLLQLARLHQEEGEFAQAIAATQLCEKLQRNELDLSQPLFDFYTIDVATPTPAIASASSPGLSSEPSSLQPEMNGEDDDNVATESAIEREPEESVAPPPSAFPDIAHVGVAVNAGPALFSYVAAGPLSLSADFASMSVTLFMRRINRSFDSAIIQIELPGLNTRNPLGAVEDYLHFFGCKVQRDKPPLPGYEGFTTLFGQQPIWVIKRDNRILIGSSEPPTPQEIEAFGQTFPWANDSAMGFLIDWPAMQQQIPNFLKPWLENPIMPYLRIYSRYRKDGPMLRETSLLEPATKVDPLFMKSLADALVFYKSLLLNLNCKVVLKIEANPTCVRLSADYDGIGEAFRYLQNLAGLLKGLLPYDLDTVICVFRRATFGASIETSSSLCPNGGTITVNPTTGAFLCSCHHDSGFFPMFTTVADRCAHARIRLEMLIAKLSANGGQVSENEGLPERLCLEYNIAPCSAHGTYHLDKQGGVICTVHGALDHTVIETITKPKKH
ncbi:MAG: tetratricopeptide repeat protein [Candidatus Riflebacteria bacterium]|nr:tetratricopeptide repeat protein [Candidatus Riflebacteria bacterium]